MMICTCGKFTIHARYRKLPVNFCTSCGRVTMLDRWNSRLVVIWPGRVLRRKSS